MAFQRRQRDRKIVERKQRDYQALYDELAKFNAIRVLESTWCFERVETDAKNLCNHFAQFIDKDDGLCVTQVRDWATRNVIAVPKKAA